MALMGNKLTSLAVSLRDSVTLAWASVLSLLLACGPSAIVRSVISVIIYTVKGMFRRGLFAHVGKEVLERILPTVTNTNAPASVSDIMYRFRVEASGFHELPRKILRTRSPIEFGMPMLSYRFQLQAATRLMFTVSQVIGLCYRDIATRALTYPCALLSFVRTQSQNG